VFPSLSTNLVANAGRGFKTQNPSSLPSKDFQPIWGLGRWMRKISIHSLAWLMDDIGVHAICLAWKMDDIGVHSFFGVA